MFAFFVFAIGPDQLYVSPGPQNDWTTVTNQSVAAWVEYFCKRCVLSHWLELRNHLQHEKQSIFIHAISESITGFCFPLQRFSYCKYTQVKLKKTTQIFLILQWSKWQDSCNFKIRCKMQVNHTWILQVFNRLTQKITIQSWSESMHGICNKPFIIPGNRRTVDFVLVETVKMMRQNWEKFCIEIQRLHAGRFCSMRPKTHLASRYVNWAIDSPAGQVCCGTHTAHTF